MLFMKIILQSTFSSFKNSPSRISIMYGYEDPVFRQKEVISPDYLPDHLPHREKEIKAISSIINSAFKILQVFRTYSSLAHLELEKRLL